MCPQTSFLNVKNKDIYKQNLVLQIGILEIALNNAVNKKQENLSDVVIICLTYIIIITVSLIFFRVEDSVII